MRITAAAVFVSVLAVGAYATHRHRSRPRRLEFIRKHLP